MEWINRIHTGNTFEVLKQMPDELVDLVITSPPYWGLRNYGKDATTIWGGDKDCQHEWGNNITAKQEPHGKTSKTKQKGLGFEVNSNFCEKCGAWKGQFGLEPHPQMYIDHSVELYREVKRVLKDTGSFYLNIGDSYFGGPMIGMSTRLQREEGKTDGVAQLEKPNIKVKEDKKWLQSKQLMLIPYRVAAALQEDGWILRSTIIWHKGNPMPTSVKDRLNNTYEPMFHFVKQPKYHYDLDSIRIKTVTKTKHSPKQLEMERKKIKEFRIKQGDTKKIDRCPNGDLVNNPLGKNPGDVWNINTHPFPKAHFAVFPKKLVEKPIKSSCPPDGIVMDIFCGTGTACRVAKSFGRKYIGIDINPIYVEEFAKEELGHGSVHEWI